jgi:hypothetical protein
LDRAGRQHHFILASNTRHPLRKVMEPRITGDVLRIELANQIRFFSRATLDKTLRSVPRGGHGAGHAPPHYGSAPRTGWDWPRGVSIGRGVADRDA